MLGVVDELRTRVADGEVTSLAIMAEVVGQRQPAELVVRGRFNTDPYRALVALQRANRKLHRMLDRLEGAISHS